ncbi:MAG: hypothetical protein R2810_16800 [Flavobacteriales bacterium]
MQQDPRYVDVVTGGGALSERLRAAQWTRIADVLLDPGFGAWCVAAHNYALLRAPPRLKLLGRAAAGGTFTAAHSINEVLGTDPSEALNGTTVLNTLALEHCADVLRVHDVREAAEAEKLVAAFRN